MYANVFVIIELLFKFLNEDIDPCRKETLKTSLQNNLLNYH